MGELLSVAEALSKLLESFEPVGETTLPLSDAVGRFLAEDTASPYDLPLFPNSSMDGFAVRSADISPASRETPVSLRVVADIPAGVHPDVHLASKQAARIMTGAPLPDGSDAVIPVEDTDFNDRLAGIPAPEYVQVFRSLQAGDYVRPRGQDAHQGEVVLRRGVRLRPQDIGLLAMIGVPRVKVTCRPQAALLSSGDELLPVDQPLQPGKIYESNSYLVAALIEKYGADAVPLGISKDNPVDVKTRLDQAVEAGVDLILTSAGVSVGAHDYVRAIVEEHGKLEFWRVNMRPGKPLAFGSYRGIPFIGLPGNPVSTFVGFEVFVRPALLKLSGSTRLEPVTREVELGEHFESDGRETYVRGVVSYENGTWTGRLAGHQGSGNLWSLIQANALLIMPSGVKSLAIGSKVNAWLLE